MTWVLLSILDHDRHGMLGQNIEECLHCHRDHPGPRGHPAKMLNYFEFCELNISIAGCPGHPDPDLDWRHVSSGRLGFGLERERPLKSSMHVDKLTP